ncbi:MAG: response regulator [Candidatus Riflebacteria bacterium]|nr:response regulator [Candidatus Riflebacteria bacterium]
MIVDDYEFMRQTIAGILRQTGYQKIFEAPDGNTAITFLDKNAVDLILCDWEMPGKTGLEVLKHVLANGQIKHTPFIMITARSALSELERAIDNGIKHFIVKPFSPDILRKKIAAVLAKSQDREVSL